MEGCSENASHFREGPSCWLDIGQAVTGGGHVVYLNLNIRPCGPRFKLKNGEILCKTKFSFLVNFNSLILCPSLIGPFPP